LSVLGQAAVAAVQRRERAAQQQVEAEINVLVRDLYGVPQEAELWVVR
jgi:hypothetical protein